MPPFWGESFIKDGEPLVSVLVANMLTMMITLITFSIFGSFFSCKAKRKEEILILFFFRENYLEGDFTRRLFKWLKRFYRCDSFIFAPFLNYDLFPTVGVRLCVKMARISGSSDSRFFGSRFGVLVWRCWFSVLLLKGEHCFVYLSVWYWLISSSV